MSDARTLRIDELRRMTADAVRRIEEIKTLRAVITSHGPSGDEFKWLLAVLDNRRKLLMERVIEYQKGIEIAKENAFNDKIGVLFIDGRRVTSDEFLGSDDI